MRRQLISPIIDKRTTNMVQPEAGGWVVVVVVEEVVELVALELDEVVVTGGAVTVTVSWKLATLPAVSLTSNVKLYVPTARLSSGTVTC